jgi:hypothetical protein
MPMYGVGGVGVWEVWGCGGVCVGCVGCGGVGGVGVWGCGGVGGVVVWGCGGVGVWEVWWCGGCGGGCVGCVGVGGLPLRSNIPRSALCATLDTYNLFSESTCSGAYQVSDGFLFQAIWVNKSLSMMCTSCSRQLSDHVQCPYFGLGKAKGEEKVRR